MKDIESKSNQLFGSITENQISERVRKSQLSEKIREQFLREQFDGDQFYKVPFDRIAFLGSKGTEFKRKSEILSLTNVNLLIEEAYSNSKNKSDLEKENRELLLNLIENITQLINQKNMDTVPSKQNIFNVHVSGENLTNENDLINLSDRLVLILSTRNEITYATY